MNVRCPMSEVEYWRARLALMKLRDFSDFSDFHIDKVWQFCQNLRVVRLPSNFAVMKRDTLTRNISLGIFSGIFKASDLSVP